MGRAGEGGILRNSPSYIYLLASYSILQKIILFLRTYERNFATFWKSQGFYEFLVYGGARDIGRLHMERLLGCGSSWGEQEHKADKTLRYCPHGCGDTLFCGRCALAKSRQIVSRSLEVFSELIKACRNSGIRLECKGLELELTIPRWLSELFCEPSNREFLREWTDRFFKVGKRTVERWFKEMGIEGKVAGVNVLHFWKSGAPWKPHVHLHFVLAPVYMAKGGSLYALPRWYEEKEFNLLRSIYKDELEKEFGEGIDETLNVHVNYLRKIKKTGQEEKGKVTKAHSLEFRLEYMFRPPVKDFAQCIKRHLGNGLFEVEMLPEGSKNHKERVKSKVSYSELRNFIDLLDGFSIPNLKEKNSDYKLERKMKERELKTTLSITRKRRLEKSKKMGEMMKENNPKLYSQITQKRSKKNTEGKGGLERIRWFGFLAKRNLGGFLRSHKIEKEEIPSQWQDTGRQLEYIGKTDNGVELKDKETGEIFEVPSILIHDKPLNITGRKWRWKYGGNKGFP